MTPTAEQEAIIAEARNGTASLLINALAGAAKTTTLCLVAQALPLRPVLCLAFNKKIAEEMKKRMPGHVECMTLNSLGHRAWGKHLSRRLILDTSKTYRLVKEEIDLLPKEDKRYGGSVMSSIMKAVGTAKANGYIPKSMRQLGTPLIDNWEDLADLFTSLDDEPEHLFMAILDRVLEKSITEAYSGTIDFDDQLYMTALFGASLPRYADVMVDETQDLSPLNHKLIEMLNPERLIAVGDPWQSIYAFRGADTSSMSKLKVKFAMKEMTLSTSFRCPQEGVKRAWFRVPHMKWADWAIPGTISTLDDWSSDNVQDFSAILCRSNAPLFSAAIKLIKAGRGVHLVGRELGPGLLKIMRKLGDLSMNREAVEDAITAWEKKEMSKAREARKAAIVDKAECLRVFADYGATLAEAIAYAEHLFASEGPIQLMTGHKAKGLEFDTVFHLDPWRIPSKFARRAAEAGDPRQLDQELNLKYVIETRWKKELFLVNLEKMQ